jgi:alpha-L-fucosidase
MLEMATIMGAKAIGMDLRNEVLAAFGSEWYPRNMYIQGSAEFKHHLAAYGPQARFGYKDFIPRFKAGKYDPKAWAALFKRAGAKYVVPVAEHHDGFPMYDSALTAWCAGKMGPERDLIGAWPRPRPTS